jgi:hypothetical protein
MFRHERASSIVFEEKTQTNTAGAYGPEEWSTIQTTEGLFFIGGKVDSIIGERQRVNVDGVLLVDYANITETIPDTARVSINGDYYSLVYMDNVGMQNELYVIPVKKYVV